MEVRPIPLKKKFFKHRIFLVSFVLLSIVVVAIFVFKSKIKGGNKDSVHFENSNVADLDSKNSLEEKTASNTADFNEEEQKNAVKTVDTVKPTMCPTKDYSHLYPDFYVNRPKPMNIATISPSMAR